MLATLFIKEICYYYLISVQGRTSNSIGSSCMKSYLTLIKDRSIKLVLVAAMFLVFFTILFIQFPLNGSLPGYIDTWLFLALFNDYGEHILAWFSGKPIGHCLYPAGPPYAYLEPSFAAAPFFWLFKALGLTDIWAYSGFMSLVFTLNALGAYLLGKQYLKSSVAALFVALAFAASNYAFGNLEHQNTLFYFPALLSVYYFRKYLIDDDGSALKWTMIWGGVQIYFGVYTFIFQSIVLLLLGLVHYRKLFFEMKWLAVAKWLPIYVVLAAPYIYTYLLNPELATFFNPSRSEDLSAVKAMSLNLNDLYRVLPNNLLYGIQHDIPQIFVYNLRAASLGVTLYVLAFIGMFTFKAHRAELLLLGVVSFVIALGPSITLSGTEYTMPMGWLYAASDTGAFLRHPVRMFFITALILAVFAGGGLLWLARKSRMALPVLVLVASTFFIIENVPFPFETYGSSEFVVDEEVMYPEIERATEPKVLLELPSSLDFGAHDFGKPVNQFTREYIYMYWQSKHSQHILNGGVAFFPPQRMENAKLIAALSSLAELDELIVANGIDYIVYHPKLLLPADKDVLPLLMSSERLKLSTPNTDYFMFEVQKAQ